MWLQTRGADMSYTLVDDWGTWQLRATLRNSQEIKELIDVLEKKLDMRVSFETKQAELDDLDRRLRNE